MGKELIIPPIQKLHCNSESTTLVTVHLYFVFHEKLSEKLLFWLRGQSSIANCQIGQFALCGAVSPAVRPLLKEMIRQGSWVTIMFLNMC